MVSNLTTAYRRLAFVAHPDQGGSEQAFTALADAVELALKFVEQHSDGA